MRTADNRAAVAGVFQARDGLHWLSTPDEIWDRVLRVQGELSSSGRRAAAGTQDLVIAAVAERHGVAVLHYDRDFDVIAELTKQEVEWVVPAGSVP